MEHGFRPLKAGKMHPNALKPLPSGAARQGGQSSTSAPQVYVVMLSSHLFMLRVQFCNTALTHRGVLGANPFLRTSIQAEMRPAQQEEEAGLAQGKHTRQFRTAAVRVQST